MSSRVRSFLQPLLEEVRNVYAELEQRPVERACQARAACCHFRVTGKTPFLTKGEAMVAAQAVRAGGRKKLPVASDGACPLLDPKTQHCMIYANRPFGCRTHFCAAAGGMMPRKQVVDLIRRLETVDADLGGAGARPLSAAVESALAQMG